jgi:flagellar motor switch protein FliN
VKTYLECWIATATALFAQALAGEPQLSESPPQPLAPGSFGFAATLSGDQAGRFSVVLEGSIIESPLLGEGTDQRAGWEELLREVAEAAAGDLLASTGMKCRVDKFEPVSGESKISSAFQLKSAERAWTILVLDEVRAPQAAAAGNPEQAGPEPGKPEQARTESARPAAASPSAPFSVLPASPALSPGIELLLDVELDASLRFGCREMPLGEILDLGPGDVVQLDRHIADPVDLIVGDKIVARGEVVLINGNFGLRITEVAAPRKRLESIRCLF